MTRKNITSDAKRVVIKVGTSTLIDCDTGLIKLINIANVVQEAGKLAQSGIEVVIVSSGAVGLGKDLLYRAQALKYGAVPSPPAKYSYSHAFAAAGQSKLMSLYTVRF